MAKEKSGAGAKSDKLSVARLSRGATSGGWKEITDDKKLRRKVKTAEKRSRSAAVRTAHLSEAAHTEVGGYLEAETPLERTFKVEQKQIVESADLATKRRASFQLNLAGTRLGPYGATYSRSGKLVLVYGRKGHTSVTGWGSLKLHAELYLNETVRDGQFLHDDGYFALAQRKYAVIYDMNGVELHTMRNHLNPLRLQFLPYHYLLVTLGEDGTIKYSDTSTGELVADLKSSRFGAGGTLRVNPANGCVAAGHASGVVTLWSPISSEPLARILTHRGAVNDVAFSPDGNRMVTAGSDTRVNLWDLRTYRKLSSMSLPVPATCLEVSQRGLLAASFGPHVRIWRDCFPESGRMGGLYIEDVYPGRPVERLSFCPFEDMLGVAHEKGFSTMIVPGAGEPNFDSNLPNPFETSKQRRNREVKSLLEKLGPETIMLDPSVIGGVERDTAERLKEIRARRKEAELAARKKTLTKKRARGRNKTAAKLKRKQQNVIDSRTESMREQLEKSKTQTRPVSTGADDTVDPLLKRFMKKPR